MDAGWSRHDLLAARRVDLHQRFGPTSSWISVLPATALGTSTAQATALHLVDERLPRLRTLATAAPAQRERLRETVPVARSVVNERGARSLDWVYEGPSHRRTDIALAGGAAQFALTPVLELVRIAPAVTCVGPSSMPAAPQPWGQSRFDGRYHRSAQTD